MPPVITMNNSPRARREVRPDEQRRFHHAEENIGGGGQADRAAHAHGPLQRPREAAYHRRQDAPVEQQRGQHAHHQHDRQGLEGEHESRARRGQRERQRPAADVTELERGAGLRRLGDGIDRAVDQREGASDRRHFEQQQGSDDRHGQRRAALRQFTGPRLSRIAQAKASRATTPSADCRCCMS
jgi:hypothetical protein